MIELWLVKIYPMKMIDYDRPWKDFTFCAIDLEASGAYPVGYEICEVAAVKWRQGQVIDTYQSLVKTEEPLSDFITGIHGISNEMLVGAPALKDVLPQLHAFIADSVMIAHHAPFDMGFLAYEFERAGLGLPIHPALCTSLLSINLIPEAPNHKLQTLVGFLNLQKREAHRALSDAQACLDVALVDFAKVGEEATLSRLYASMPKSLDWKNFSMDPIKADPILSLILEAIPRGLRIETQYGAKENPPRKMKPEGYVRSPDGDFVAAFCEQDMRVKRFYPKKFNSVKIL